MLAMRQRSQFESPRHRATLGARLESALELTPGTFALQDPRALARSLGNWSERRSRDRATAFRSAMSLLVFYAARMAQGLSKDQRARLEAAKVELRALYTDMPPSVALQ